MTDEKGTGKRDVWIVSLIALIAVVAFVLQHLTGCGKQSPPAPAPVNPSGPTASTCDGGLKGGDQKVVACVGGATTYICTDQGLKILTNTCQAQGGTDGGTPPPPPPPPPPACTKPSYAAVQPVLSAKCAGACHSFQTSYDAAKSASAEMKRRINLPEGNDDHMPLTGKPALSADELGKMNTWLDAGAPEKADCGTGNQGGTNPQAFIDFPAVEAAVKTDLTSSGKSRDDQLNSRYLVTAHRQEDGSTPAEIATLVKAMDKTLNEVNETGQSLFQVVPVDAARSIWRVDLRNFGISSAKWRAIEAADRLKIISQTNDGAIIRALSGTNEPIFMAENFVDVTHRAKGVYYTLLNIPAQLTDYQKKVGVDFAGNLRNLEVSFIGTPHSLIAEQKNRLALIMKADGNGQDQNYYAQTFDTVRVDGQPLGRRNLSAFPLLQGTGGGRGTTASVHNFQFDAGEVITSLPNGLQAYSLWNNVGARVDFANPQIVTDTETPVGDKTIQVGNSCGRCHPKGLIPFVDLMKGSIAASGTQLNATDAQLVDQVYHDDVANQANFGAANAVYAAALKKIGIDPNDPDPMNASTDRFLENWNLAQTAAYVLQRPDDLKKCITQSNKAKGIASELLADGGQITHDQFVDLFPVLITDCRLFQDPLNQQ